MGVTTMIRSAGELCAPLQRRGLEHGSHLFAEEYPRVCGLQNGVFFMLLPPLSASFSYFLALDFLRPFCMI